MNTKRTHTWKRSLISLLLAWGAASGIQAQETDPYLPQAREQILPTPTSRAFMRYPGYKPDLATGAASLTLPLYTAQEGDLSIPFALSYYSNGVKVQDNSFPLGYGWTFTPGLRITRTVMGKPDENDKFDYNTNKRTYKYLYDIAGKDRETDAARDLFSIHLPNHNFTFLMEKVNGAWNILSANDALKIVPQINTYKEITGFEVTDEHGIVYSFGGEFVEKDTETGFRTGWMLYQAKLPGNAPNTVSLTWEKHTVHCDSEVLNNDYFYIQDHFYEDLEYPGMTGPGYTANPAYFDFDYRDTQLFLPKKIEMPHQVIEFVNEQVNYTVYMDKMTVKNKDGDTIKECRFTAGQILSSVYISGEGTYNFDYYGGDHMDIRSQDFWGYYNGKKNATSVPGFNINIRSFNGSSPYPFMSGADRDIDATAMQNYLLRKVTYPTKGYMQWEYEPHRFKPQARPNLMIKGGFSGGLSEGGGLRVKKTVSCPGNGMPEVVRTYKYGTKENGLGEATMVPDIEDFIIKTRSIIR